VNNNILHYDLNTNPGWSGGVVINKNTSSIIAIHKGGNKKKKYNAGIFIKVIIENIKETNYFMIKHQNPLILSSPRQLRGRSKSSPHDRFHLSKNNAFKMIEKRIPNHDLEKLIILGASNDFPNFGNYRIIFKKPSKSQIINSYSKAKYFFFIFDITNKESFINIKKYMEDLKEDINSNNVHKILLGHLPRLNNHFLTKFRESILSKQREALGESFILDDYFYELKQASIKLKNFKTIPDEESEKLAVSLGMIYFEIYPFMNYDTFFDSLIRLMLIDESK